LSYKAIEVILVGEFLIFSGVKAPPISHSISKNTMLCHLGGSSSFKYSSINILVSLGISVS